MFVLAVSTENKSNITFLKEERGKIFLCLFLDKYEDRPCKGVLNIPLLQGLSSIFSIPHNSLSINYLIINLQAIVGSDCWT